MRKYIRPAYFDRESIPLYMPKQSCKLDIDRTI